MKKRLLKQIIRRYSYLPGVINTFRYGVNSMRLLYARKLRLLKLPHPNVLMLEVTNYCQLHCITCAREYEFGNAMDVGHMDLEKAKKLIDESHWYLDKIALTGLGEPLLYPHLKQLVEYIREKNRGVIIFLSTNAQHPKTISILSTIADKIDTVQISIDGIGDNFEKIRKNGNFDSFKKICKEITGLSEKKPFHVKLNMVVFEENYRDMEKVIPFAKECGINELGFNSLNQVAIDKGMSNYSFYTSVQFKEVLQKAHSLAADVGVSIEHPNIGQQNSFSTCPFPWGSFTITWDGYLVPCCAKPFWKELHFGNAFKEGLMSCINSEKCISFRKFSNNNITPDFCYDCHHVY